MDLLTSTIIYRIDHPLYKVLCANKTWNLSYIIYINNLHLFSLYFKQSSSHHLVIPLFQFLNVNLHYFICEQNVRLIQLAVSLGGVESLIEHPATMTHGPMLMTSEDRLSGGITDGLVRIRYWLIFSNFVIKFNSLQHIHLKLLVFSFNSIGIEDPDDLIKDLQQALDKIPENVIG